MNQVIALATAILLGGSFAMTDQHPSQTAAAAYVAALRSNISGIYYQDVDHFEDEYIVREFRKAVADPALREDETFMSNQLFLVRKRAIQTLYPDVAALVGEGLAQPRAMVSALKTLFALGNGEDRRWIDQWLAHQINASGTNAEALLESPFFKAAEGLGGPDTLAVLTRLRDALAAKQQQMEQTRPDAHQPIALLDRARSESDHKVFVLAGKQAILALPEPDRSTALARLYLLRPRHLGVWAHHLLTDQVEGGSIGGVRQFLDQGLAALLPAQPSDPAWAEYRTFEAVVLDYRLRGLCLLEVMGANLSPAEEAFLAGHQEELARREAFFRPRYDWEDLLDQE